ncbi:hypothetical protein [Rhodopseudomonas sp. BAL398]|nr:hypothetical protein [Rhodopseudomonas sp. BAL398]MDF3810085.1 hypothetical protein [Rhodopseudomonas sp. BAL398]WOK18762.1 hypothetical protein RBJ75_04320 [Rhodopseudomonas sp. BAL398]
MATTIKQNESEPLTYPDAPEGLSAAAVAIPAPVIWERIEAYVAHRWAERDIEWLVEGPGEWSPPLAPATIATVEVWSAADEWEACTPNASPFGGYWLSATGPFRFTGTVGPGEVPATVSEAYRRLAEYMAAKPGKPGATSESIDAGSISISHSRSASWLANAMINSGAGDLLRSYRKV